MTHLEYFRCDFCGVTSENFECSKNQMRYTLVESRDFGHTFHFDKKECLERFVTMDEKEWRNMKAVTEKVHSETIGDHKEAAKGPVHHCPARAGTCQACGSALALRWKRPGRETEEFCYKCEEKDSGNGVPEAGASGPLGKGGIQTGPAAPPKESDLYCDRIDALLKQATFRDELVGKSVILMSSADYAAARREPLFCYRVTGGSNGHQEYCGYRLLTCWGGAGILVTTEETLKRIGKAFEKRS